MGETDCADCAELELTPNPITRRAVVDHDARTVTFAVTLAWGEAWAMSTCEMATVRGHITRTLAAAFADWETVSHVAAVETWEPNEERHIGDPARMHRAFGKGWPSPIIEEVPTPELVLERAARGVDGDALYR
jgi:hypothetical protein